jgi:antitoxin (DNA-binding transcriptional repressor) of toxin-antitoxin stability system
MIVKTIDINKTSMKIEELLALMSPDTEIMLTQNEIPLARLSPLEEQKPVLPITQEKGRIPNLHPGSMIMSDDFDDPLPDEFWLGEDA